MRKGFWIPVAVTALAASAACSGKAAGPGDAADTPGEDSPEAQDAPGEDVEAEDVVPDDVGPGDDGITPPPETLVGVDPDFPLFEPPEDAIHIDPTNAGDPDQDGSLAHPFESFEGVVWTEGVVVAIRRGTTLEIDVVGVGAHGVTVASYGDGPRPRLQSTAVATPGNNRYALMVDGRRDVTFRDLDVAAPDATSPMRFQGDTSANVQVINCRLQGGGWGLRSFTFSGLRVINTEIFDTDDDGVFLQDMTDIEIANCHVHHVNRNWQPPATPESEAAGDAIQLSNCNRWHVHHNLLDRSDSGNKFCFISNNPDQDTGLLEHNVMLGPLPTENGGASIYFHDGSGLVVQHNRIEAPSPGALYTHAFDLRVEGNVIVGMGSGLFVSGSASVVNNTFYGVSQGISGGVIEAVNNIFAFTDSGQSAFGAVTDLVESHNLLSEGTPSPDSFVGDPGFVDPGSGDFHPGPGSAALDRGLDVGLSEDMDGVTIPQGAAPDIGAYERP